MITTDLSGNDWVLFNKGNEKKIKNIQMNLPGDVHSALIRANIIPDPYYGFNEKDVQWVGRENWSISKSFVFHQKTGTKSYLRMDMADTFFTVFINGKKVGKGDNYFRLWRFDVTKYLVEGKNTITINFDSAENHAIAKSKNLPYPVPCSKYDMYSPHRNLVRKIQCHSGWDWGPCLMAFGVYGQIGLETVSSGYIKAVTVNTTPSKKTGTKNTWVAKTSVHFQCLKSKSVDFLVELKGPNVDFSTTITEECVEGLNEFTWNLEVENPILWKSADQLKDLGLEENELYNLKISTLTDDSESPEIDCVMEKNIGFRTLVLQAKPDRYGCSLYYELNGRALFAKGANWIPVDSLPERWTYERYYYFLKSAVDTNMNSLRFWGGGQYESDMCYNICDRLGLIIWQDCTFACSLYPADENFLWSVEQEIEENVYRLQHHPSLAVWCGNNEDFGTLNWYPESRANRDRYLVDYDRLNHGTIEKTIKRCDPERTWWPSSPCAGPDTFGDNWHNDSEGDMHFWSVWHEKKDMEEYLSIKPRFVSEFGYESFPSLEGVLEFAEKDDANPTSPVMEWHQRSPSGNSIMLENFSRYFRFPCGSENMFYLSQVQQALAVKTAVDYWRSLRPHCMGATFWQLNDIWPVASWSSIEYSGKWKLLNYAAKDFFKRVRIVLIKKDGKITLNAINESLSPVEVDVSLRIMDLDGNDVLKKQSFKKRLDSDVSEDLWESEISKLKLKGDLSEYFLHAEMKARTLSDRKQIFEDCDTLFLERWKKCKLRKAKITSTVEEVKGQITLTLESDYPTFYVSPDVFGIKGFFDRSMITLLPGKKETLIFTPSNYGLNEEPKVPSTAAFRRALKIYSLRESYE